MVDFGVIAESLNVLFLVRIKCFLGTLEFFCIIMTGRIELMDSVIGKKFIS